MDIGAYILAFFILSFAIGVRACIMDDSTFKTTKPYRVVEHMKGKEFLHYTIQQERRNFWGFLKYYDCTTYTRYPSSIEITLYFSDKEEIDEYVRQQKHKQTKVTKIVVEYSDKK